MSDLPGCTAFHDAIGSQFALDAPDDDVAAKVRLELTACEPFERADSSGCSLLFEGPGEIFLPQQTYPLVQAELGQFLLFLVPIGNDSGKYQYQAILNSPKTP